MEYKNFNDYELLYYISEGNEDANNIIIKKYEPLINKIAIKMLVNLHMCQFFRAFAPLI
jgi:DNA-directed RNA polymerase specialized sigma subunit